MQDKEEETKRNRDLWYRLNKALRENNEQELKRLHPEVKEALNKKEFLGGICGRISGIEEKVMRAEKEPNIARCVLTAMEELKSIGLWDGKVNNTYRYASDALSSYNRVEKARVEYKAARKAFQEQVSEYHSRETALATNLIYKQLQPLGNTPFDPLMWYQTAPDIIKFCKRNGVTVTVSALRKYQALGLIPKPIRKKRKAEYSVLTVLRVLLINRAKKEGYRLNNMREAVEGGLRNWLNDVSDTFPHDRTEIEDTCGSSLNLTDANLERFVNKFFEKKD